MLHEDPRWHSKGELEHPELLDLLKRWQEWARMESIPLRSRFDPVDFPRLLPWMILGEILADAPQFDARMRYVGSEIVHYFKSENLTGKLVSDLPPIFARRWSDVGKSVVTACSPQIFEGRPFMVDKAFVLFEMLTVPLSKSGHAVDFIIVAMAISR